MPIKQPEILSRADFDEAVVKLRLNVSELAKETGIPRTYLSEFRNGDRKLRPEHLAKLRDYFEDKGIQFDADAAPDDGEPGAPKNPKAPHPRLALRAVCFLPVRSDLPDERVRAVMQEIERNDQRIAELRAESAEREDGFLRKGDYTEKAEVAIRELFGRCTANYCLMCFLTGKDGPLSKPAEKDSLHALLVETLRESIERAGIQIAEATETEGETAEVES